MAALLGHEIANKQIIDVIHGRSLGNVEEIYYDAHLATIVAVSLGFDAAGSHGIITSDEIVMFGKDAVLVKHSNVAVVANRLPASWIGRTQLIGTEVRTLEGMRLGLVLDFFGEADSPALSGLVIRLDQDEVTGNLVLELPVSTIRALSFDHTLVVEANLEDDRLIPRI
jgi:uncharacterized protein YrrD